MKSGIKHSRQANAKAMSNIRFATGVATLNGIATMFLLGEFGRLWSRKRQLGSRRTTGGFDAYPFFRIASIKILIYNFINVAKSEDYTLTRFATFLILISNSSGLKGLTK